MFTAKLRTRCRQSHRHPAEKIFYTGGKVTKVTTTKLYPSDTLAIAYWPNNHRTDRWRRRQEVAGPKGGAIELPVTEKDAML